MQDYESYQLCNQQSLFTEFSTQCSKTMLWYFALNLFIICYFAFCFPKTKKDGELKGFG